MFRAHQDAFGQLCFDIAAGKKPAPKSVICSVTPGGGKSLLPVIAANQLIPAIADRIAWVVPRRSLQEQAEAEFAAGRSRELLHNRHLIRKSTGELDPCRGLSGFCTTYQAIGANPYFLNDEFSQRRYVLILDEPHHVEEGGAWEMALKGLVRRAALTVFMSGTLERGNRRKIAFLPYGDTLNGENVDLSGREVPVIEYNRTQALLDKAILPIHFELMDGAAQWVGRDGKTYSVGLSSANKDTADALYTALKTQFGEVLLHECASDWLKHRLTHPRSKFLAVTANIEEAKKYLPMLKSRGIRAAIATSDDSALATENIARFKSHDTKNLDALVTVAMAYEGLDVPSVTHIACLTHIRSKPWIEQMLARATRFDSEAGAWEEQMATVYVPDDRLIGGIIGSMQDEQLAAVKQRLADDELEARQNLEVEPGERRTITPVGSDATGRRWNRVGHFTAPAPEAPLFVPSQQESQLREKIQNYCKQVDALFFGRQWGETNKRVVKTFGQSRQEMPLPQLQRVLAWLQEYYPV